ncbi:hypothetical protein CRC05_000678 [Salmonella enterica subsp. enterica serovar Enteritidis]|nr:hypothetical protein [Salmonella enterica subsp. enterica serovar Enteritidis]
MEISAITAAQPEFINIFKIILNPGNCKSVYSRCQSCRTSVRKSSGPG